MAGAGAVPDHAGDTPLGSSLLGPNTREGMSASHRVVGLLLGLFVGVTTSRTLRREMAVDGRVISVPQWPKLWIAFWAVFATFAVLWPTPEGSLAVLWVVFVGFLLVRGVRRVGGRHDEHHGTCQ